MSPKCEDTVKSVNIAFSVLRFGWGSPDTQWRRHQRKALGTFQVIKKGKGISEVSYRVCKDSKYPWIPT